MTSTVSGRGSVKAMTGTVSVPLSRGTVVDGAVRRLDDAPGAWYGCGPQPMLRALAGRLEAAGVRVLRTDLDGSITVKITARGRIAARTGQ